MSAPGYRYRRFDGVSDNGQEIYNFCKQEGIINIALMGVHTNICVLNRGFGIRQMTRLGFDVAVVRDLTDSMYDPRKRPFVSHASGTELVVEHIETRWCSSISSAYFIPGNRRQKPTSSITIICPRIAPGAPPGSPVPESTRSFQGSSCTGEYGLLDRLREQMPW